MSVNISLTRAEFDALMFADEQINEAIEGAIDEGYIKKAIAAARLIKNVRKKFINAEKTKFIKRNTK